MSQQLALMIGSQDPKTLSDFYSKVLDKKPEWEDAENGWYGFGIGTSSIAIGPHSDVSGTNSEPARLMINIAVQDPVGEYERVKATGAKVIAEPYDAGDGSGKMVLSTFEDPDGNYFQITSAWED